VKIYLASSILENYSFISPEFILLSTFIAGTIRKTSTLGSPLKEVSTMPLVLLIRHGENEYVKKGRLAGRLPGVHLNDKGRAQAAALAEALIKAPLKAVYSSPLDRTMETAAPLAEIHKLQVIPREGLLEVDYGSWQDKTLKQLSRRKLWKTVQSRPSHARFPEGETFAQAQLRIVSEINELCAQHKPKDIIACVGHSDMLKLAVAFYLGLPLDLFQRLTVQPASVSTLHIHSEGGARLINLNHIPYKLPENTESALDARHDGKH
jgi:probable phosphoglycerate mutase